MDLSWQIYVMLLAISSPELRSGAIPNGLRNDWGWGYTLFGSVKVAEFTVGAASEEVCNEAAVSASDAPSMTNNKDQRIGKRGYRLHEKHRGTAALLPPADPL